MITGKQRACQHANVDEYFGICDDCDADLVELANESEEDKERERHAQGCACADCSDVDMSTWAKND
jgi:hypothetical protein